MAFLPISLSLFVSLFTVFSPSLLRNGSDCLSLGIRSIGVRLSVHWMKVDWHENRRMLKVAFPLNVHSLQATYEVPYGLVERPTHQNTSWDMGECHIQSTGSLLLCPRPGLSLVGQGNLVVNRF